MKNAISKFKVFYNRKKIFEIINQRLSLTSGKLKDHSTIFIRAWRRQCEYILAQRFRRTQQMFCLYTTLWEENALKELLSRMRQQMSRRSKELVFGAIGVSSFNWDENKITNAELSGKKSEFEYVKRLQNETVICKDCHLRRLIDVMLPDTKYCKCPNNAQLYTYDDWTPFLERKDLIVWRRKRPNANNFEYKMYGIYNDVTAEDFLQVQIDTEYRQKWDTTAVKLHVVDTEEDSNSDIIYWEMLWPRMFSNRDYVYNRRYSIDTDRNVIVIMSKSTEHPTCPVKPDKHRVNDYHSCMVIQPLKAIDEPGIAFSLTYYDDPGVNIPAAVTSWVAVAGMPDFLCKLRQAAKHYKSYVNERNMRPISVNEVQEEVNITNGEDDNNRPPVTTIPSTSDFENFQMSNNPEPPDQTSTNNSYWRYIHPYYYLG